MYFVCKICNSLLLLNIEFTLIHTICYNGFSKLSTGQLMKNQTVLPGVNHCTIVKLLKFFGKLGFFCKLNQSFQYIIIHLLCSIVVHQSLCHWNTVIFHTLCPVLARHNFFQIYATCF